MYNRWIRRLKLFGLCFTFATVATVVTNTKTANAMTSTDSASGLPSKTVTVTGIGTLSLTPAIAQLTYGISVSDSSVHRTIADMNALKQKATATLKHFPIGNVAVSLSQFNSGGNNSPNGTVSIVITMPNSSKVDDVLSAMGSINANYIQNIWVNIQYLPQDLTSARNQLFKAALADAQSQAEFLASSAGEKVGSVVSMSATSPANGPQTPFFPGSPSLGGVQSFVNNNSTISMSSQVTVTYQLVPAGQ